MVSDLLYLFRSVYYVRTKWKGEIGPSDQTLNAQRSSIFSMAKINEPVWSRENYDMQILDPKRLEYQNNLTQNGHLPTAIQCQSPTNTPSTGPDRETELDVLKTASNQQLPNIPIMKLEPQPEVDDLKVTTERRRPNTPVWGEASNKTRPKMSVIEPDLEMTKDTIGASVDEVFARKRIMKDAEEVKRKRRIKEKWLENQWERCHCTGFACFANCPHPICRDRGPCPQSPRALQSDAL